MANIRPLTNSLPQSKTEYYQKMVDHVRFKVRGSLELMDQVTQMTFTFYHCEVPLEVAKIYLMTYVDKVLS